MAVSRFGFAVMTAVVLVLGAGLGFLVGYFTRFPNEKAALLDQLTQDEDPSIADALLNEIDAERIRENLKDLTAHPHLAGTPADREQADMLKRFWMDSGLDRAEVYPYNVLLSYPEKTNPNKIVLYDEQQRPLHTSQLVEEIVRPEQDQEDVVPPFNAYSASGTPKGNLIYVNYGRVDDFIWLNEKRYVDFRGLICIARYGKIFRGDKAKNAEDYGCIGLLMYTDPADYAVDPLAPVYPNSWYLPGTGVQRGTLIVGVGDPLTPGYPAIDSAYRLPVKGATLPKIPVHPIGYDDALVFLQNLTGQEAPHDWQGGLDITYRIGPGFSNSAWKIQMYISTHNTNRTTYNAMGFIEGAVEPDRYILLGNHRDAWVFGAVDPSSGTASMMELSRAMGKLHMEGWKPRRSIVFCSWGAEEQGLVGSQEWTDHFSKILGARSIAYLNVDIAVQGNFTFRGRGMPLLYDVMYDVAKHIPNPNADEVSAGRETIYDTWKMNFPQYDQGGALTGLPDIPKLGSGSDFAPFVIGLGVTSVDLRYHYNPALGLSSYPLYHSVYETFHLVETFYDPHFHYHRAVAQYWGELARRLADKPILPFDVRAYSATLAGYTSQLIAQRGDSILRNGLTPALEYLQAAVRKFEESTKTFHERLQNIEMKNPLLVRGYNDQMMNLERAFIDPQGLPGRPLTRHVIYAPSAHNSYSGSSFPALEDAFWRIERVETTDEHKRRWMVVHQQMAVLTYFIESAADTLLQPVNF